MKNLAKESLPEGVSIEIMELSREERDRLLKKRVRTSYVSAVASEIREGVKKLPPFGIMRIKIDKTKLSAQSLLAGLRKEFKDTDIRVRSTEEGKVLFAWVSDVGE